MANQAIVGPPSMGQTAQELLAIPNGLIFAPRFKQSIREPKYHLVRYNTKDLTLCRTENRFPGLYDNGDPLELSEDWVRQNGLYLCRRCHRAALKLLEKQKYENSKPQ